MLRKKYYEGKWRIQKLQLIEVILIGVGLAMDAFAVAICKGLQMKKLNYRQATVIALFFGGFQALMPLIGWILGKQFEQYIVQIDHWIAFGLLSVIGVNMFRESLEKEEEDVTVLEKLDLKELVLLAIATSIDALAVGITFAFLKVDIKLSVLVIGITTFLISFCGVAIGNIFGTRYKERAERFGGIVLILIGLKILLEHLGILII